MKRTLFAVLMLLTFAVGFVGAQDRILIGASSVSGTYEKMVSELSDYCSTDNFVIDVSPKVKGGVLQNLDALKGNQVSAAFVRADVVFAMSQSDPAYHNFKTLVALYPEDIHILVLRQSRTKKLGVFAFGYQEFTTASDLAGFAVGAASGGNITARILTGQLHFSDVKDYQTGKEVFAALDSGEISAAVFVGGTPLPALESLSGDKYKLLPIGEGVAAVLSGVYRRANISYSNLRSGSVPTLSSDALIITRKYTTPKMIAPQAKFRQCFYDHLTELQEEPGKAPKWQEVNLQNHGTWDWYEIPGVVAPAATHKRK